MRKAGQTVLLPAFNQHHYGTIERKQDGSMVTTLDRQSQEMIRQQLALLTPKFTFLGEEMEAESQQQVVAQSDHPCWCLDPLDGTSNFIAGMPCFAISLGLLAKGEAIAGWVYDPIADEMWSAPPNSPHLYCNDNIIPTQSPSALDDTIGFIDFKRLQPDTARHFVTHPPCHSYRNLGSCALEWAWLAGGRAQFIIHGRESLWDFAAGLALTSRTGAVITDLNGQLPLQADSLHASILAAANPPLHHHFMQYFATCC
ncbi:MAG: inositol monophosphatase family protein [Mariprofundales bacterium]